MAPTITVGRCSLTVYLFRASCNAYSQPYSDRKLVLQALVEPMQVCMPV